jgi:hypothetical protein
MADREHHPVDAAAALTQFVVDFLLSEKALE